MEDEVVRAPGVTIRFNAGRCIHSRNCVLDRPDVFVPNVAGEWIHPERATVAEVLEIAHNCPSGAIHCEAPDGTALEQPPIVNTVRVRENGPLAVRAQIELAGSAAGCRLTLCRCGASHWIAPEGQLCAISSTSAGVARSGWIHSPCTLGTKTSGRSSTQLREWMQRPALKRIVTPGARMTSSSMMCAPCCREAQG